MWWSIVAAASELVLHRDADVRVTVASRVAEVSGTALSEFEFQTLREWTREVGPRFSGGTVTGCTEALSTPVAVQVERITGARERVTALDLAGADDRLYRFERDLVCGDGVIPQDVLAGAYFLRGQVAVMRSDLVAAEAAFRTARSFDPDLSYAAGAPPAGRATFAAVAPPVPSVWVQIVPEPDAVWVDGERVSWNATKRGILVAPGRHVITGQATGTSTVDVVVEGEGVLAMPDLIGDSLIGELADPRRQHQLAAVITLAAEPSVWLSDVATVWRVQGRTFTPVAGVELPSDRKGRKGRSGRDTRKSRP